jgi:hypothetical protein
VVWDMRINSIKIKLEVSDNYMTVLNKKLGEREGR